MHTDIAYRIRTTATDESGRRIKFETLDRARAVERLAEVQRLDPKAKMLGIPVAR